MGWLEVSREYHAVAKRIDGLRIDLGGVGKGFAVDRIAERLAEWQVGPALISAGRSTVRAVGAPPNADAWTLDLRDPRTGGDRLGSITLRDATISGSGIALHGRHIIDPRTGQPAAPRQGAWACCPSAALSDCLSTAFMVLRREEIESVTRLHPRASGLVMWTDQADNERTCHGLWPASH
jgi:thiamine biosynthesis lipoprotein